MYVATLTLVFAVIAFAVVVLVTYLALLCVEQMLEYLDRRTANRLMAEQGSSRRRTRNTVDDLDSTLPAITSCHQLQLAQDSHLVRCDDNFFLLDLGRDRFYGLDPTAAAMVIAGLEGEIAPLAAEMARRFDVPEARIERDYHQLASQLADQRTVIASTNRRVSTRLVCKVIGAVVSTLCSPFRSICHAATRRPAARQLRSDHLGGWFKLYVNVLLTAAWISLRTLGWTRTVKLFSAARKPHEGNVDAVGERAAALVDHAVRNVAAGKFLFSPACKERAIVGYYLLRNDFGQDATLLIGIDPHPFLAHAWVECHGQPVTDDRAHCDMFRPVLAYTSPQAERVETGDRILAA